MQFDGPNGLEEVNEAFRKGGSEIHSEALTGKRIEEARKISIKIFFQSVCLKKNSVLLMHNKSFIHSL